MKKISKSLRYYRKKTKDKEWRKKENERLKAIAHKKKESPEYLKAYNDYMRNYQRKLHNIPEDKWKVK